MRTSVGFALALLFAALHNNANAFLSPCCVTKRDSSSLQMTILTYGNKKMDFKPGSPLKTAVAKFGIKPKYSCNK
jgi:hypothetical protein